MVPLTVHYTFESLPTIMPLSKEIGYSRDAVVAAVRDYYEFLVAMYLPESQILQSPDGG